MAAYTEKFGQEAWYKPPQMKQAGHCSLSFKDEKTAITFAEEQAKAGHKFIMMDAKTGNVKGYSDDTTFYKNTSKSLEDIQNELGWQSVRPNMR